MSQKDKYYDQKVYKNFYSFYNSLEKDVKRELRKQIAKKCRVADITVTNWLTKHSIPVYQSNRVTECVRQIAVLAGIVPSSILEKVLFPDLMMDIMYYEQ